MNVHLNKYTQCNSYFRTSRIEQMQREQAGQDDRAHGHAQTARYRLLRL